MAKVKIQDIKNPKIIKEVEKSLASDYVGTGRFKMYEEPKKKNETPFIRNNDKPSNDQK